jgi:prepilin-type N-terminal cleavage/methylation domain-containing protein
MVFLASFMDEHGFSIIELMVVIILMAILSSAAMVMYRGQIKDSRFKQYAYNLEYLVKNGKMYAMERTTNIGICVATAEVTIYDIGASRSAGACSGTLVNRLSIESDDMSTLNISFSGTSPGITVDPRGLTISPVAPAVDPGVCVSNGAKYFKIVVYRTNVRTEEGSGSCP